MTTQANGAKPANNFDALLEELDVLQKAQDCGDGGKGPKKIKKAAADGAAQGGDGDEGDGDEGGDETDVDDSFGKAFEVTLADGTKQEAFDGTQMLKALHTENQTLRGLVTTQGADLTKALEFTSGLFGLVKSQGEMIKALQADVTKVGNTGTGRRGILTVLEKQNMGAGAGDGKPAKPARGDVMAKALSLQKEGHIGAVDVARIEANFDKHGTIPTDYQGLYNR